MTTRSLCAAIALLVSGVSQLLAHPGVGIVMDRRGVLFYTDLVHVWQIDRQGRRSIAVANVHTHELAIDNAGNLIGEEVRGGASGWEHRVWRRSPDGRITDLVPWTTGFWREFGLLQDSSGHQYWVSCPDRRCTIWKRGSSGGKTAVGGGTQFNYAISWIAVGPDGMVYLNDGPDLRRINAAGTITTVAGNLAPPGNQHALMGLNLAPDGSVYVAVPSRRAVMQVSTDGRPAIAARSPAPWAPSGVLVEADGTRWLLEFDSTIRVQVRRIRPSGEVTTFEPAV